MIPLISRRTLIAGAAASVASAHSSWLAAAPVDSFVDSVRGVEARLKARIGVVAAEVGTDRRWLYRQDERFPMASTFKAFACAALLARVDAGERRLDDRVAVTSSDLVPYAPVTEKHVGGSMSLAEICAAATAVSDNAAANLILDAIGGPGGMTAFMRRIGDTETRLDRRETELNEGVPGDLRDTTTPAAAAESFRKLVLGDVLSAESRGQLQAWLIGNQVAGPLLRASLPQGWRIADRTGAGGHGTRSVLAVLWPPRRPPIVAAIYLTETGASMDARNAAIAEIGSALVRAVDR